jgi:hypothetical protein
MRTLQVAFILSLAIGQPKYGQRMTDVEAVGCWDAPVHLSPAQTKSRLRQTAPILSPLLYSAMRITNATLRFSVAIDSDGNVICIRAISGHPLIIGVAIDSIQKWKFRPTTIKGHRQPVVATLALSVSGSKNGLKARILTVEPPRID